MAEGETVLRRKLAAQRQEVQPAPDSGAKLWRTAFARAAHEAFGLDLATDALRDERLSLTEVLDMIPAHALMAVLEGPDTALGLLVMSPALTAAVIEAQTMGRVGQQPALPRRPTRTDAAMCAGLIDRALTTLELSLASSADLVWAGSFRYASFLEEARTLGLLLDDLPYRALLSEIRIEGGARSGQLMLILPAEGRGPQPVPQQPARSQQERLEWEAALTESVLEAELVFEALIGRIKLPLGQANALVPGAVLPLDGARTDNVVLRLSGGGSLPAARLGQHRGQRAVKLVLPEAALAAVLPPGFSQPAGQTLTADSAPPPPG